MPNRTSIINKNNIIITKS